jgi:hypothetical protein
MFKSKQKLGLLLGVWVIIMIFGISVANVLADEWKRQEKNLAFIEEYLAALSWQPKPPEVYEQYIKCKEDQELCDHIDEMELFFPEYGLDALEMEAIGDDRVFVLAEVGIKTPMGPLSLGCVDLIFWIEGNKIVNHLMGDLYACP